MGFTTTIIVAVYVNRLGTLQGGEYVFRISLNLLNFFYIFLRYGIKAKIIKTGFIKFRRDIAVYNNLIIYFLNGFFFRNINFIILLFVISGILFYIILRGPVLVFLFLLFD